MIAADIMTENVRFIRPEETISDAVELLQSLEVRHLPVVNEDDELVGMLSDRDLRALLVPFDEDGETAGSVLVQGRMPVSKVMSSNVAAVESEDSIWDVVDRMLEDKVGAVPVVDSENKLVGIISYVDILRNWQEDRPDGAPVHRSMPPHIKLGAKAAHAEKAPEEKASAKKAAPKKAAAKSEKAAAKSEKAPAKKAAKAEKKAAKASAPKAAKAEKKAAKVEKARAPKAAKSEKKPAAKKAKRAR